MNDDATKHVPLINATSDKDDSTTTTATTTTTTTCDTNSTLQEIVDDNPDANDLELSKLFESISLDLCNKVSELVCVLSFIYILWMYVYVVCMLGVLHDVCRVCGATETSRCASVRSATQDGRNAGGERQSRSIGDAIAAAVARRGLAIAARRHRAQEQKSWRLPALALFLCQYPLL
jgi:hypothetical protein